MCGAVTTLPQKLSWQVAQGKLTFAVRPANVRILLLVRCTETPAECTTGIMVITYRCLSVEVVRHRFLFIFIRVFVFCMLSPRHRPSMVPCRGPVVYKGCVQFESLLLEPIIIL